jgi:hypothetical protein
MSPPDWPHPAPAEWRDLSRSDLEQNGVRQRDDPEQETVEVPREKVLLGVAFLRDRGRDDGEDGRRPEHHTDVHLDSSQP